MSASALLLDLDGTLLDSTAAVESAWLRFASRCDVPEDRVRPLMHGIPAWQVIEEIRPGLPAEERAALAEAVLADMARPDAPVIWLPGAQELVAALVDVPWAVATSGNGLLAASSMRKAGMTAPRVLITSDDVSVGKPEPEPYLRAAELLGVSPAECVVIEDAPAGVAAGLAAGMRVIAVTHTYAADVLAAATAVVDALPQVDVDPATHRIILRIGSPPHRLR
jgi:sugar-phosphatase